MKRILFFVLAIHCTLLWSQEYFPKNDGVKAEESNFTAFTNASIQVDPENRIEEATLLIKDGKVEAIGKNLKLPENTVVYDLNGKSIYPSFIDVYSGFGIELPKGETTRSRGSRWSIRSSA